MDEIKSGSLKAAIYVRVSTADQHVESQLYDLRELARQRGYIGTAVSQERERDVPGLDALVADARQKKFSVVLVAAFDRVARSVKHFLQVMDEFNSLGIVFISRRENIDTSGPMGRLFLTLIGSIAELESDLMRERVLAGMRRAKLDGVRIGRREPTDEEWRLGRISPAFGRSELERQIYQSLVRGVRTFLDNWGPNEDGEEIAYVAKSVEVGCLASLASTFGRH